MKIHAETYKGFGFHKFVHRSRLKKILSVLKSLNLTGIGRWADFGCSDGFMLEQIRLSLPLENCKFYGFDHSEQLLAEARKKDISDTVFRYYELNTVNNTYTEKIDIVTCFETLEHTGNYRKAFDNLYVCAKSGGHIIISIPNEIGFPGIAKYIGRRVLRRKAYDAFFSSTSTNEIRYVLTLFQAGDIEKFRSPSAEHWGSHLGFSFKNFEAYLDDKYLQKNALAVVQIEKSFLGFNRIYVFRKTAIH